MNQTWRGDPFPALPSDLMKRVPRQAGIPYDRGLRLVLFGDRSQQHGRLSKALFPLPIDVAAAMT